MGNSRSKILPELFCCCGPGTTDSEFELSTVSSNPRDTGSGDSIRSDTFDETTQVIVHDTLTNRNSVAAKENVENNPNYMVVLLPERCNETVVQIEIPESSLSYTLCELNFGELGLKTKRQQGLIPYIYVTRSQGPAATRSSATGATQPSTQSLSSPSQRSPRRQISPSPSRSRPNPMAPRAVVQIQPRSNTPPSRPQPTTPGTAVHPQARPSHSPSRSQPQPSSQSISNESIPHPQSQSHTSSQPQPSSQSTSNPSIPHPQSQPHRSSSSPRTARVSKPTATRKAPPSTFCPPPLPTPILPMPNG